jgi:hypothetical protein
MTMGCKNERVANSLVEQFLEASQLSSSQQQCLSSTYTASNNHWRKSFFTQLAQYINCHELPHQYDGETFPSVMTLRLKPNCGICVNLANSGKCTFLGIKSEDDLTKSITMVENLLSAALPGTDN